MKAKCGKCKTSVNVNVDNVTTTVVKFKCPVCGTLNRLDLSKFKNKGQASNDKTTVNISGTHGMSNIPGPPSPQNLDDVMGWLVVHDENTRQQTHSLKMGKNIVGRKSVSKPCDVMIDTDDTYMSRNHFAIEIGLGVNGLEYLVYDVTSTNGTFINADKDKRLSQSDRIYLSDGDTIQAGRTKMVLRTKKMAGTAKNATDTVINTAPLKTIIVQ